MFSKSEIYLIPAIFVFMICLMMFYYYSFDIIIDTQKESGSIMQKSYLFDEKRITVMHLN